MRQDGREILARWREAGEWWKGEPYREWTRYIDSRGVIREEECVLSTPWKLDRASTPEYEEDHREDWSIRMRKARDEKVAKACGYLPDQPEPRFIVYKQHAAPYVPLHVCSGYSFGRGTMLAEEIPVFAANLGLPAIAIADRFALTGAVEFSRMAQKVGVKPLIGAAIELVEGCEIVLIARSKRGYQNLSQLITACHLEEPRLFPLANWRRLEAYSHDLLCLSGGMLCAKESGHLIQRLLSIYGRENLFLEIERSYMPWQERTNHHLLQLAEQYRLTPVASGLVTHARPEHFPAQDMLTCIDSLCLVEEIIGRKPRRDTSQTQLTPTPQRALNAERYLKTSTEIYELYADRPDLLANTLKVAEKCDDNVLPGRTKLPELYPNSEEALREITYAGGFERRGKLSSAYRRRLDFELDRISSQGFAGHFLVAWDFCRWSREQDILFSGRGSVVDSAVAYCLGLSRIDAFEHKLHFERFLPVDGSKRPDIDIDFEAKRRDDVRNYVIRKYGEEKVATVCAVGAYCSRGIVREVGKALGLPPEAIAFLAKRIHGGVRPDHLESALEGRPELRNSKIPKEKFMWVFRLAERMMDIPRNMRSHSSGVVISSEPIAHTVPLMWSGAPDSLDGEPSADRWLKIIQWDKRSAKHYFDKFDILCLRGQDVLSGTQRFARESDLDFSVERAPIDNPETYRAMRSGHLIGVPQSASPAMRQAHIRLRTENLHDASLVQAGIRPGVGGAVKLNELIARRRGKAYGYTHPEFERILGLTYGIIVFQEQVDQILQTFCGYSSGQAEDLRDAIYKKRREDFVKGVKDEIIGRVVERGHGLNIAHEVYDLVAGFQGYGFAQGHALAFAEISIRSIYCQQNYPAEYFAALLNAQPAGYYGPCTLANEARTRGVAILPPDVNASSYEFKVEDIQSETDPKLVFPRGAIRTGLSQVKGLSKESAERIVANQPYHSLFDLALRSHAQRDEIEALVLCGALDHAFGNHLSRRSLLWNIQKAVEYASSYRRSDVISTLPLSAAEPDLRIFGDDFSDIEKSFHERSILDMDVQHHLMSYERSRVAQKGGVSAAEAGALPDKTKAFAVGNPIRLRFPPTASGRRVVFFDLEDETGLLNVTCFDETYQRDGHNIICSPYVTVVGEAQDRDGHTAFLAHRVFRYHPRLDGSIPKDAKLPITTADFLVG